MISRMEATSDTYVSLPCSTRYRERLDYDRHHAPVSLGVCIEVDSTCCFLASAATANAMGGGTGAALIFGDDNIRNGRRDEGGCFAIALVEFA
jgi:hypothetical protein